MTCNRYFAIITFLNFPNITHRFAARCILDNFEISLAVLSPKTTSHATLPDTYNIHGKISAAHLAENTSINSKLISF